MLIYIDTSQEITIISQQATVYATHITLLLGAGFIMVALMLTLPLPDTKNIETEKSIAVGH